MASPEPAMVFFGDLAALLFSWLVGSIVLKTLERGGWIVAIRRAFGLSLICLSFLLGFRLIAPDMLALPVVFLLTAGVYILASGGWKRNPRVPMISILIAISILASLLVVDQALRIFGYHLTVVV